jgi:hypothetical protein
MAHHVDCGHIRCWSEFQGRDLHGELTSDAFEAFRKEFTEVVKIKSLGLKLEDLRKGLMTASTNMDYRKRIVFVNYWDALIKSGMEKLFGVGGIAGEGPRHGEGKDYTVTSMAYNAELNVAKQNEYVDDAVKGFDEDRRHTIDDVLGTIRGGFIAINEKEWVKDLANALHVAQDRGSHREGTKGFGHDDPRCYRKSKGKKPWSPDDPIHEHSLGGAWERCSMAAFNRAFNNSCDVFHRFLQKISRHTGIEPQHPERKPEDCLAAAPVTACYLPRGLDLGHQCLSGRSAKPVGYFEQFRQPFPIAEILAAEIRNAPDTRRARTS